MAAISLEGISKVYPNGHPAVRDVSLDISDGELVVLVGPSGCGKSTLLRLLAGLEEISAGRLAIDGQPANHWTPRERNIAMVFQDYALYPNLTVRGNLEFPLKMRKRNAADIRRKVAWAVEMLDLGPVLDRLPRQLSGGQRQRVAMGRALVREPSVFLLDEPLSNLDAKLRTQVRTEIADLQRRTGTTMIYVTHDQVEAMTLGRRIAVLQDGRIQQAADPETLYARPANPFVAGFVGNPPMNLFDAGLAVAPGAVLEVRAYGEIVASLPGRHIPAGLAGIVAGIRPEDLGVAASGFSARVVATEYLGHETLLHVRVGTAPAAAPPWIVRRPGLHRHGPDELIRLAVAPDRLHLFVPDNPDGEPRRLADGPAAREGGQRFETC